MPCNRRGRLGRLGFTYTGTPSSRSSSGGGGATLDLSPIFNWFQSPTGDQSVEQTVRRAGQQVSALAQRVARLKAANEAEDQAIDQAQSQGASASCSQPATWTDWARCHRMELLLGCAALTFLGLMFTRGRRRR